jgi:hypothetical protein
LVSSAILIEILARRALAAKVDASLPAMDFAADTVRLSLPNSQ